LAGWLLRSQVFETEKQLQRDVRKLETVINTTRRLPALHRKTLQDFLAKTKIRPLTAN